MILQLCLVEQQLQFVILRKQMNAQIFERMVRLQIHLTWIDLDLAQLYGVPVTVPIRCLSCDLQSTGHMNITLPSSL